MIVTADKVIELLRAHADGGYVELREVEDRIAYLFSPSAPPQTPEPCGESWTSSFGPTLVCRLARGHSGRHLSDGSAPLAPAVTKEWVEKMAALEDGQEVGAGSLSAFPFPLAPAVEPELPRGFVGGTLYCYGGCGTKYRDFPDFLLPTPLWNRITVGPPFDNAPLPADDREGRGGVLCPSCIIQRLAALPECTAVFADIKDFRQTTGWIPTPNCHCSRCSTARSNDGSTPYRSRRTTNCVTAHLHVQPSAVEPPSGETPPCVKCGNRWEVCDECSAKQDDASPALPLAPTPPETELSPMPSPDYSNDEIPGALADRYQITRLIELEYGRLLVAKEGHQRCGNYVMAAREEHAGAVLSKLLPMIRALSSPSPGAVETPQTELLAKDDGLWLSIRVDGRTVAVNLNARGWSPMIESGLAATHAALRSGGSR